MATWYILLMVLSFLALVAAVLIAEDGSTNARVELEPIMPLLKLKDIDEIVRSVDCSASTVTVSLKDSSSFEATLSAWSGNDQFAVLTSHVGCQKEGEQGVWIVQELRRIGDAFAIELGGEPSTLRGISPRMHVELGNNLLSKSTSSVPSIVLRRGVDTAATGTYETAQKSTPTFTYQTPTASATGTSSSADISFSRVNTTLLPPDSSIVDLIPHAGLLKDVQLSCVNCTLTGNIELVAGGFTINNTETEIVRDFVEHGYLEFKVAGLSAMMDFQLAFLPGFSLSSFNARLPDIPLGAIAVADVLEFGPILQLGFPITVTLNNPVTLRTGFTLTAPSDVTIYLNMSHPEASYTTGLSETKLEALPFTADINDLSVNLTTGFHPQLILNAGLNTDAFNASAGGLIGVYLDLPQLAATIDVVDSVNEDCDPTTSNAQNNLIRIESSVTYDGGAEWEISANVLDVGYDKNSAVPWLSNTTVLPSQCLMWDAKQHVLVKATAQGSSGSSNTGSSENTASRNMPTARFFYITLLLSSMTVLLV